MVKIKISESESYQIEIPQELDREQFIGVCDRFALLAKLFSRDKLISMAMETSNLVTQNKIASSAGSAYTGKPRGMALGKKFTVEELEFKRKRRLAIDAIKESRDLSVGFVKASYYHKVNEYLKTNNLLNIFEGSSYGNRKYIEKTARFEMIHKHNIKPSEVGLLDFPQSNTGSAINKLYMYPEEAQKRKEDM